MVKLRILSPAGERQVSHDPATRISRCRSPIETSPASPKEMSRSLVCLRLVEVAWGDGDHDEPQRADALSWRIMSGDAAQQTLFVMNGIRPRALSRQELGQPADGHPALANGLAEDMPTSSTASGRSNNWDLSWPERCVMPYSTASCAALESAQCDFSHSLQDLFNGGVGLISQGLACCTS
jgi:hypothetical protein